MSRCPTVRSLRILGLLLALVAPAFAVPRLSADDLPAAVRETLRKEAPQGEFQRIYRSFHQDRQDPDFHVILNSQGKRLILLISSQGKILSRHRGPIPAFEALRKPPTGSVQHGFYEGKLPCADCQRVKVALTLHRNAQDASPTTYLLQRVGVGKGNETVVTQGIWTQTRDACGSLVRLGGDTPRDYSAWLAVGEDLLLLLDADLRPRVGDSAHSFTLSRTE